MQVPNQLIIYLPTKLLNNSLLSLGIITTYVSLILMYAEQVCRYRMNKFSVYFVTYQVQVFNYESKQVPRYVSQCKLDGSQVVKGISIPREQRVTSHFVSQNQQWKSTPNSIRSHKFSWFNALSPDFYVTIFFCVPTKSHSKHLDTVQ